MIFNILPLATQEALGATFATAVGCTGTPAAIAACLRIASAASLNGLIALHVLTYPQAVAGLVGPANAAAVAALYPPANFPNPYAAGAPSADQAWGQIFTDVIFTCHGLSANQLLAKFVPVYAYEFADPNAPNLFQPLIGFSHGASHASELQYLFDPTTLQGPADAAANATSPAPGASVQPPPLTAGGTQLAAEMKAYWTNFVKHGTPNGSDVHFVATRGDELANWPRFDAEGEVQLLVPGPAEPHPFAGFAAEHNCQQLQALGLLGG